MKTEQELIRRAVVDPEFRKRLLADAEGVIKTEGYEVSAEVLEQIKKSITMTPAAVEAAVELAAREGGVGG